MQGLLSFLSTAPALATIWLTVISVGTIVFIYYVPDNLLYPF